MEDTLREHSAYLIGYLMDVLILVLMEDTLRVLQNLMLLYPIQSLNPCFNGRYSQSAIHFINPFNYYSLNPCFNGRYSQRPDNSII